MSHEPKYNWASYQEQLKVTFNKKKLVSTGLWRIISQFTVNSVLSVSLSFPGDDISGSGSGMCVGGQCPRSRPGLYAYSPDNNRVRGAAAFQTGFCSLLLLLPATLLLLLQRWWTTAAFGQEFEVKGRAEPWEGQTGVQLEEVTLPKKKTQQKNH